MILTNEFGRGFSKSNIEQMRKFYLTYSKTQTVSGELRKNEKNVGLLTINNKKELNLGWSHYLFLMRLEDLEERNFYEIEAFTNNWSIRELKRQFNTGLYQRLVLSREKDKIKELSLKGHIIETTTDLVKDPYILEFLGLEESSIYTESELENRIIDKLEHLQTINSLMAATFNNKQTSESIKIFEDFQKSFEAEIAKRGLDGLIENQNSEEYFNNKAKQSNN